MSLFLVGVVLVIVSFVIALVRPGRFGPTALSLATGYVLATFWSDTIANSSREIGVTVGLSLWHDAVFAAIVIVPALFVLLLTPKRQSVIPRIISAVLLAVLVLVMLLPIFSLALIADSQSRAFYRMIENNKEVIVTITLLVGLIDMAFARHPKRHKHAKD